MKFAFTATIALLLFANLAQAERQSERAAREAANGGDEVPESPATHGNTRNDDSPFAEGDEDFVKKAKTYSNNEK
jgi:hypothetical protein